MLFYKWAVSASENTFSSALITAMILTENSIYNLEFPILFGNYTWEASKFHGFSNVVTNCVEEFKLTPNCPKLIYIDFKLFDANIIIFMVAKGYNIKYIFNTWSSSIYQHPIVLYRVIWLQMITWRCIDIQWSKYKFILICDILEFI